MMMQVKFKLSHPDAVMPCIAKPGDAGMDLTAVSREEKGDIMTYGTGVHVEIPEGYVGLLFPRSSVYKQDLMLANSVGVIDSGYRGEIMFKYRTTEGASKIFLKGERVGQLVIMPIPEVEPIQVDELSDTERGDGGFGSTGA